MKTNISIGFGALLVSALSLNAACGNTIYVGGSGGAGTSSTNSSVTTGSNTTTGYSDGGWFDVGGSGGWSDGGSGGGACDGFQDSPPQKPITLRLENKTGQPIYLPNDCDFIRAQITPASGQDGLGYFYDSSCLQTCQDLQTEDPYACGACAPSSYRLDPGKSHDLQWDGTAIQQLSLPGFCAYSGQETSCGQIVDAPQQAYSVTLQGSSSCSGPADGCSCDSDNVCYGEPTGQTAVADVATFNLPNDNLVEVVFNVCAFGCTND